MNQRWRLRQDSYRPAGEPIRTQDYEVAELVEETAKAFVVRHHYSGSFPAARFQHGLYRRGELMGVSVFSHPTNELVLAGLPGDRLESCELGRFVLLDDVPANGETWFLGRSFELLRRDHGQLGVLSFSDPVPRVLPSGLVVMPGHVGTIYQAFNGVYLGRATARTLRVLPDGHVLNERSLQKIRARERGWRSAARPLEVHGALPLVDGEDARAWLRLWLGRLTRAMRHPGNHRYAWSLNRRVASIVPSGLPYPKRSTVRA